MDKNTRSGIRYVSSIQIISKKVSRELIISIKIDILKGLLCIDPQQRLTISGIKHHPWCMTCVFLPYSLPFNLKIVIALVVLIFS